VIRRVSLNHRQCFAPALRRAKVIIKPRAFAVNPFHDDHGRVVSLLHLHVTEIADRLLIRRPIIPGAAAHSHAAEAAKRHPAARSAWSRTRARSHLAHHRPGTARWRNSRSRPPGSRPAPGRAARSASRDA